MKRIALIIFFVALLLSAVPAWRGETPALWQVGALMFMLSETMRDIQKAQP